MKLAVVLQLSSIHLLYGMYQGCIGTEEKNNAALEIKGDSWTILLQK